MGLSYEQIAIPLGDGIINCMKAFRCLLDGLNHHVPRRIGIEPAKQDIGRVLAAGRPTSDLTDGMYTGICPPARSDPQLFAGDLADRRFKMPLHGPLRGLPLPTGEVRSVVMAIVNFRYRIKDRAGRVLKFPGPSPALLIRPT